MFATSLAWACLAGSQASAQQPMGPAMQGPGRIALIDMGYILSKHFRLKSQLAEHKARWDKVQAEFEQQSKILQEHVQALRQMKIGTPDYSNKEEECMNEQAAFKTRYAKIEKEFQQEEAKLLWNAYNDVTYMVDWYCNHNGIVLVMNFSRAKVREEIPRDIQYGLSKPVVFYNPSLDITDIILPRFLEQPHGASPDRPGVYPNR